MTNHDVHLAIIINCYNYERYIHRAIDSVITQKNIQYELIVIDDGSSDTSWEVINKYKLNSFRKSNGGQVSACRYGVSKTTAPFVMFLDADDELLPGSISEIVRNLDSAVAKLQFPLLRVDADGKLIGSHFPNLSNFRDKSRIRNQIEKSGCYISPPTSGNVFRRDLCSLLEDADYDSGVDGILLIAAPFFGDVVSLKTPLGLYRIHSQNNSGTNRIPTVSLLQNHQERFCNRVKHLKNITKNLEYSFNIKDPSKMYYFIRSDIYCDIIERRHVSLKKILDAIRSFPDWYSLKKRFAVTVFLFTTLVLPNNIIRTILFVRLKGGWMNKIKSNRFFRNV